MNTRKFLAIFAVFMAIVAVLCACRNVTDDVSVTTVPDAIATQPTETEPQREPGVYFVTILPSANGTVTANCAEAREGDTITLTVTPDEGYELLSLTANGKDCQLTFAMPAEDVSILARFGLPEQNEAQSQKPTTGPNGKFFGSAGGFHSSDALNMKTDSGKNPCLVMDADKATPLFAYVKNLKAKQFYVEATVQVTGIRADEGYPKFGFMTNDGKEMVKFYLDMNTEKQVGTVGAVHQKSGKEDDWAGQTVWNLNQKLDLTSGTVKLGLLRDGSNYYLYVNGQLVACGGDLSDKNAAVGIFSFGTSLKVTGYQMLKSATDLKPLLAQVQADADAFHGAALSENFFSKAPNGVYSLTTDSDAQHLVDDVTMAGKVMRQAYYSLKGKITLTDADAWGQARILISADAHNEYFIALEKTGADSYQIFTMSKANQDGWDNWELIKGAALNGNRNNLDFEVIVVGNQLYFLIDDAICYTSSRVSMTESTVKFTGYNVGTTSVRDLSAEVFTDKKAAEEYVKSKCTQDFSGTALTENFFKKQGENSYVLTTDSDAQHKVDDVICAGQVMKEKYYSLKGKLTLTDADIWGQARILISADARNEYFVALEKTGVDSYQIFTMSKAEEESWNDWRLIESAALNGNRNSIDFEVVVISDQLYFLIGDKIFYTSRRVSMTESTVKFTGYNIGTTTVQNLSLQTFDDSSAAAAYIAGKSMKAYESQFQSRMDALYEEYMIENGCEGNGGTLIFGDSNMDFWSAWEGQTGLTKYINGYNVGIGGSTVTDWLHAYDQLIKPFNADRFVILVGGNDVNVWGDDGEVVVQRLKTLFEKLHVDHPNAEIYYIYTTPSPSAYSGGVYTPAKLGALVEGSKALCESLDYVQGIDMFDLMTTADQQDSNTALFADDRLHMSEEGYKVFSEYLYATIFRGENFGAAGGYITTNGIDLTGDKGEQSTVRIFGGAPRYAYLHDVYTDKFCFETQMNVEAVLNNDHYPKFGLMVNGESEMVKFYVDMTAELTAAKVGVVYQPADGADDWAGAVSCDMTGMSFTGDDTVKLKLVRDGRAYYFYVNDELVLYDAEGFAAEQGAVGIFSFNSVLTASDYAVAVAADADAAVAQAKEDLMGLSKVSLTTNYFTETQDGVYTLTTDSDAQHKIDDVKIGRTVLKTAFYSVSGKLTLTDAGDWGQARILVSADPQNEYFIALEKTYTGNYQIFTMSKAGEEGWNDWKLIESAAHNGSRNSIDFELIVNGDLVYFLIADEICYISSRVAMTESTVKFTGFNGGTTTVENLSVKVFADSAETDTYAQSKDSRIGDSFGVSEGTYSTTEGVNLTNDKGENPTVSFVGGAPQYGYLHDLHTDKFCFETQIHVTDVLNNDGYPKFGIMVNGSSEMVKFFVDMTPAMTATHVGVVYQPTGGGDDWNHAVSCQVPGMSFTGADRVKLKLVRDGRAYYFYVNDSLVLYNEEGFTAEKGAVGIFSFNAAMTASDYSVLTGSDANSAVQSAKNSVLAAQTKLDLTCNWFVSNGSGVYTLTTDSNAEHKVDDLTRGGNVLRAANYSVKGKLTLTNANDWGQARILISGDAKNEYFIALEKTNTGNYQIFTMSKANQNNWDVWELILHQDINGSRNSVDFEVLVIENKLYFLIDDVVVYTRDRVPMSESTVKFTGYNVGTTTVEDLSAQIFENKQEAESYLAEKNG